MCVEGGGVGGGLAVNIRFLNSKQDNKHVKHRIYPF